MNLFKKLTPKPWQCNYCGSEELVYKWGTSGVFVCAKCVDKTFSAICSKPAARSLVCHSTTGEENESR